jgi:hypothetical protein
VPATGKDAKAPTCEAKRAPQSGSAEDQSQLQALVEKRLADIQSQVDKKFTDIQSQVDKKFTSFSQYVDQHLASIDSKLEALAEALHRHEHDFDDFVRQGYFDQKTDDQFNISIDVVADRLEKRSDEKLEQGLDGIRSLISATVAMFSAEMGDRFANLDEQLSKLQGPPG